MHQQLLNELRHIKNIKGIHSAKKLFHFIENKEYTQALLHACKHCRFNHTILFQFIETLLRYRNELPINVNAISSYTGMSPISYAVQNKNNELFHLLERAGANADYKEAGKPSAREIYLKNGREEGAVLQAHLDIQFVMHSRFLNNLYTQLPSKEQIPSDVDNAQHDLNRLSYMIKRIDYLLRYCRDMNKGNLLPVTLELNPMQKENLYNAGIHLSRMALGEICTTIRNLSGSLRSKYSKHFELQPFTWITLEQLGSILKIKPLSGSLFSIPIIDFNDQSNNALNREKIVSAHQLSARFYEEFSDSGYICEEAIPSLINNDLPRLKVFLEKIQALETATSTIPVDPVRLMVTKTLTSRFMDNQNIMRVLNLLNYSDNECFPSDRKKNITPDWLVIRPSVNLGEEYKQRFDLTRKSGRHAALRRLQLLGELFTGKNFSSDLFDLDDTIDWRAFITIRDAITHQDERDHKYKIDTLLADPDLLERIMGSEFSEFTYRFHNILNLREQKNGCCYEWNPKKHWENILKVQISKSIESAKNQKLPNPVERRASEADEAQIVAVLKSRKAPEEITERFIAILNGTGPIPNKKELGALQLHFPPRKEHREQFNQLAGIMSKAISKQTSEKERNAKRNAVLEQAKQRELEREATFKGLKSLRDLAKDLNSEPTKEHMLSPEKRVEAAIEALNNLQEFLMDANYLDNDKKYLTMEEWDTQNLRDGRPSLVELLASNHELSDALEYNAGQLLQHLDTIREFKGADFSKYLGHQYESLRALRNYIEHGDPLLDTPGLESDLQNGQNILRLRQERIAPVIISLIFELGDDLAMIRKEMHARVTPEPVSSKDREKEKEPETRQDKTNNEINDAFNRDRFFNKSLNPGEFVLGLSFNNDCRF